LARRKPLRIDFACGQNKREGFTGVDIWDGADIVHDLTKFPWPFDDSTVTEAHCSHYVEHTPDLIAFMNELHRVLKKDAQVMIIHPDLRSNRAFQDPTHLRFIPPETWSYFDPNWLKQNGLDHYPITADFEQVSLGWSWLDQSMGSRAAEYAQRAALRDWNVIGDLVVVLKARK
jgi:predicted SAM-dependent methyltransferase